MTAPESAHQQRTHYDLPALSRWIGFVALCVGMFMAILDIQVVVTSLKTIEEALGIGPELMSWMQTSYIIAEVVAIPIIGLVMRVFGMQRLFVIAITLFTVASVGCAMSQGFWDLMVWRVIQGFAGGILIPLVFSAIFLMFPRGFQQTTATTIGGFLAVLAPTLGPVTGGWITEHYSWHWLFLINVVPGVMALLAGYHCLPRERPNLGILSSLDWLSLVAFGIALGMTVIGLKEAPGRGWLSPIVISCFVAAAGLFALSYYRPRPAILFHLLEDRALGFGCGLSFLLGFVLFSAVYILPVFLGFVRGHGPLAIGLITIVMGLTQIFAAPVMVQIDRFFDARLLTAIGFTLFAVGLGMNTGLTINSDYNEVFWAQIIRGAVVTLCVLPPIRIALALQPLNDVNDASGLFNLVRNIGGVLGIAVMDTIMFSRQGIHAEVLTELSKTDPAKAAALIGITLDEMPDPEDATAIFAHTEIVELAGLTLAINECWWVLAGVSLLALPLLLWMGPVESAKPVPKRR